jgi:hypothetical protein
MKTVTVFGALTAFAAAPCVAVGAGAGDDAVTCATAATLDRPIKNATKVPRNISRFSNDIAPQGLNAMQFCIYRETRVATFLCRAAVGITLNDEELRLLAGDNGLGRPG